MHTIIIGGGSIACCAAAHLLDERQSVAIVEQDPRKAEELALRFPGALVVCGTGTDSKCLSHAHIADADTILALTGTDSVNIVACVLAERLFNVRRRVALSACNESTVAFDALGIECICGPETVAGALLQHVTTTSLAR